MKRAAINRIRQHQAEPIRIAARDGQIAEHHLRLHAAGQMHQVNFAARYCAAARAKSARAARRFPTAENFFDLREHGVRGKIADDDQQRVGRRIIVMVELLELRDAR